MLRQSDIIAIAVSATIALLIAGFMISSTRKTLRDRAMQSALEEKKFDYPKKSAYLLGGSKLKSKKIQSMYLLFAGVFIGYILSHFF